MTTCIWEFNTYLLHGFYLIIAQSPAPVFGKILLEGHFICGHSQVPMSITTRAMVSPYQPRIRIKQRGSFDMI